MCENELVTQVRELRELKAMVEELAGEITAIEDAIKAEMTARNIDEMTVDVFKVRWTRITSSRIDTTALKNEMPELAERFKKTTESRRFTVV